MSTPEQCAVLTQLQATCTCTSQHVRANYRSRVEYIAVNSTTSKLRREPVLRIATHISALRSTRFVSNTDLRSATAQCATPCFNGHKTSIYYDAFQAATAVRLPQLSVVGHFALAGQTRVSGETGRRHVRPPNNTFMNHKRTVFLRTFN